MIPPILRYFSGTPTPLLIRTRPPPSPPTIKHKRVTFVNTLTPVLTSIYHENAIKIPLASRNWHQAKVCLLEVQSQALILTGEARFSRRFFINIPEILHANPETD